ncbi:hypothetical protein LTR36_008303 [Oleoguttula mirabilis]|uniref:Uncharacterized protein n=1 Tax=Oleoguttula mirabilis TaxID=1507867 RepID=A0AAV9J7L2_9PEZI|nr:hypothetical protein LTR36_008303 [Oleoguttula mirabilis]
MPPYQNPPPVDEPIIRHGRYAFDAPRKFQNAHPADLIFSATVPIVEKYILLSFRHESDPLLIEALSSSPTLCYACDTTPAVHCLVRFHLFVKVQLKLVCDLDACRSAGTVMLRDGERWRSLKDWLRTLPAPTLKGYGKAALEAQYRWWRSTGRPFRFLELPKELHSHILLFAFGEHIEPEYVSEWKYGDNGTGGHSTKQVNLTKGTLRLKDRNRGRGYDRARFPPVTPVNLALLGLSKQTREMALDVLWADTTKTYRSPPDIWSWDTRVEQSIDVLPEARLGCLRRIQLALRNDEYVLLFTVRLPGVNNPADWSYQDPSMSVWNMLPNLKYINVDFQSTAGSGYSPWCRSMYRRHPDVSDDDEFARMDFDRLPCQKVLLHWMLCFAAKHIIHIPTIELTGFLKTCTKQKWEAILYDRSRTDYMNIIKEEQQAIVALPLENL